MAALATATPAQKVERYEARDARRRAEDKAATMVAIRNVSALGTAAATGALKAYSPSLATFGPDIPLLETVEAAGGLVIMLATKGGAREAGQGVFLAGAVPLLQFIGEMTVNAIK